jgi:hypothetical protein
MQGTQAMRCRASLCLPRNVNHARLGYHATQGDVAN